LSRFLHVIDCSCGPDCEKNGNCCFPETAKYNNGLDNYEEESTCLFPMTNQPVGSERIAYQSYYMVTSSLESYKNGTKFKYNTSCGSERVAPWGSLYPVYSSTTKRIYKNEMCATRNGVTDAKPLDAVLYCAKEQYFDNKFMVWPNTNSIPEGCIVHFIYRGSTEDISHLKCYTNLIDTCPDDDFNISSFEINLEKENVIEMCTSGLVSPFKSINMYANVFCHICNEGLYDDIYFCEVHDGTVLRAFDDRSFLGLVDGIFLTENSNEKKTESQNHPIICSPVKVCSI
jgi:hypothetical protein